MTSDNTPAPVPREVLTDCEALTSLAVTVLNEHVNAAGLCTVCGCVWPCELLLLADHNYDLAALRRPHIHARVIVKVVSW